MAVSFHCSRDAKLLVPGIHTYAEVILMGYAYVHAHKYILVCMLGEGEGGKINLKINW